MLSPEERQLVAGTTRVVQIIIFALAAGAVSFLAVAATMPAPGPPGRSLVMLGVGFAVLQIVLAIVLPQIIGAQHRKAIVEGRPVVKGQSGAAGDAAGLLAGWQVRRIICGALLDGAAFFNIFVYMQERHSYSLAAAAALIAGILTLFPLRPLVEQWLEKELRTVRELRGL